MEPKKMNVPRPQLYSAIDLAMIWTTTAEHIYQLVESGKLTESDRWRHPVKEDFFADIDPKQDIDPRAFAQRALLHTKMRQQGYIHAGRCFRLEEVLRFERENSIDPTTPGSTDASLPGESENDMVIRLRSDGLTDKEIACRLKAAFPKIFPSKIGRLLPARPGVKVSNDAYRKRGGYLLKQCMKKNRDSP